MSRAFLFGIPKCPTLALLDFRGCPFLLACSFKCLLGLENVLPVASKTFFGATSGIDPEPTDVESAMRIGAVFPFRYASADAIGAVIFYYRQELGFLGLAKRN